MLTSGGEEQQRLEKVEDLGTDDRALVRYWLMEIDNAGQVMKSWDQDSERICKKYRDENRNSRTGNRFNILAANINTMRPALYNSTPIPDIRRRNQGIPDPITSDAAAVMERAVSLSLEDGRFDCAIRDAIMDMLQGGRGVVRVRNTPIMSEGEPVWYSVCAERVPWKDFRHQPEGDWSSVNWCAFRHYLDRDQLEELNPEDGSKVRLDYSIAAEDTAGSYGRIQSPTDVFKRAAVWEIWDKRTRRCLFVAPSWKKRPLKIEDDPLRLEQFFPVAPPIWADKDPDSMVPLPDFRLYEDLASELDEITRRIQALIRVCKWRGIYNSAMGMIASLESADDGDLKPVDMVDPTVSLDNYVWLMPVERVAEVLQQLYLQRKEILGTIYEITGLSDIIRGNTDPNETLGSQRIKAQWASGKLSTRQGDVARLCRDIIRMEAEIIVEHWPPEVLSAMTGIMVTPQIAQLLSSDQLRMWRIDVETDSTIQADLSDARENIGQLIEGIGSFVQAIAPAVMGGLVSKDEVVKLLAAFSKPFRLGRSAEQVFDEMVAKAEQEAQQPAQPPPPDPKMIEVQATDARERQKMDLEHQREVQKLNVDAQFKGVQLQIEHKKAGLDEQSIAVQQQLDQAKVPYELQQMEIDLANKRADAFAAERARQDAADRSQLDRQAFVATKRAEIAKAEADARASTEMADIKKQIEIAAAQQEAAASEQQRQMDMEAFTLQKQVDIARLKSELTIAQSDASRADEISKAKAQIELQSMADREAAAQREQLAISEDARRRREIDEKAYLRAKEAELVGVEADAAVKKMELAKAQADTAIAQAEAMRADEVAKAKAQIEIQALLDKEAAAQREQLAVAEDANRRRQIDEKAYVRAKEAELSDVEANAVASKTQAFGASSEMVTKQAMMDAQMQQMMAEYKALLDKTQFEAQQRAQEPARQEEDARRFDAMADLQRQMAEMMQTLVSVVAAPKMVVRDNDGIIVGTRTVLQ